MLASSGSCRVRSRRARQLVTFHLLPLLTQSSSQGCEPHHVCTRAHVKFSSPRDAPSSFLRRVQVASSLPPSLRRVNWIGSDCETLPCQCLRKPLASELRLSFGRYGYLRSPVALKTAIYNSRPARLHHFISTQSPPVCLSIYTTRACDSIPSTTSPATQLALAQHGRRGAATARAAPAAASAKVQQPPRVVCADPLPFSR